MRKRKVVRAWGIKLHNGSILCQVFAIKQDAQYRIRNDDGATVIPVEIRETRK